MNLRRVAHSPFRRVVPWLRRYLRQVYGETGFAESGFAECGFRITGLAYDAHRSTAARQFLAR
jgi:hypothetical protein